MKALKLQYKFIMRSNQIIDALPELPDSDNYLFVADFSVEPNEGFVRRFRRHRESFRRASPIFIERYRKCLSLKALKAINTFYYHVWH